MFGDVSGREFWNGVAQIASGMLLYNSGRLILDLFINNSPKK